ncbi:MAG: fumarylacetoacetase, partial [Salibacteraceae bacterium]
MLKSNNPQLKSWVEIKEGSDFPIQNLPFGIFSVGNGDKKVGVALGDYVIDLAELSELGYLDETGISGDVYLSDFLNDFMAFGRKGTRA